MLVPDRWTLLQSDREKLHLPTHLLWIDALCIDQENPLERNQQVAQMRDIYKGATEVIVFLGEESGDTVLALRLLHGLANLYDLPADVAAGFISHLVREQSFKIAWVALGHFLHRPWWTRVWIIQETVMARKATVICGQWYASWEGISKATACFKVCSTCIDEIRGAMTFQKSSEYFLGFIAGQRNLEMLKQLKFFAPRRIDSPSPLMTQGISRSYFIYRRIIAPQTHVTKRTRYWGS